MKEWDHQLRRAAVTFECDADQFRGLDPYIISPHKRGVKVLVSGTLPNYDATPAMPRKVIIGTPN